MSKVRIRTLGNILVDRVPCEQGTVVDTDEATARYLIGAGVAEAVHAPAAEPVSVETAEAEQPDAETADAPVKGKRNKS